jgi:hypothetical protein
MLDSNRLYAAYNFLLAVAAGFFHVNHTSDFSHSKIKKEEEEEVKI